MGWGRVEEHGPDNCSELSRRVQGKQREKSVCKKDKAGGRVGESFYHSSVL